MASFYYNEGMSETAQKLAERWIAGVLQQSENEDGSALCEFADSGDWTMAAKIIFLEIIRAYRPDLVTDVDAAGLWIADRRRGR